MSKKTKRINVKMSEDEYAMLEILANYYDAPKSKIIRKLISKDYNSFLEEDPDD